MFDKNMTIKVANRNSGYVGYSIPELNIRRQFMPKETKEITFKELEALSFIAGGRRIIEQYLIIKNEKAIEELGLNVEPEYFYTEEDVKKLLLYGSLNEFLDCLDFAPDGVLDLIKNLAVDLEINDLSKRNAILAKLNFDVTKAIEIKNTKYDGDADGAEQVAETATRRAPKPAPAESKRRVDIPQYKVTSIEK